MTDAAPIEKVDPETLVLRARPRRVIRFKRNVLAGISAIALLSVVGLTWLGLGKSHPATSPAKEAFDPDKAAAAQKNGPEQLQALPKTYADLPAGVPKLGPPLPGDLGKPIMEHAQAQGSAAMPAPSISANTAAPPVPGLFFQVANHGVTGAPIQSGTGVELEASPMKVALSAPADDQNGQGHKLDFTRTQASGDTYNAHALQMPASPYEVMAGTVISATLVTGLNSDLPGTVIAQVTSDVFDTVSGSIKLIPQGTRLIGEYDSVVSFGQSRALLVWKRMIMPDGSSLEIDNLPATDSEGYAGLTDRLDYHTFSLLKGVGLSTLLGIAAIGGSNDDSDLVKALRESTRDTANQAGQKIVDRTLNVQPTLKVRPGWPLRVIVHKDLILKPYGG